MVNMIVAHGVIASTLLEPEQAGLQKYDASWYAISATTWMPLATTEPASSFENDLGAHRHHALVFQELKQ